MNLCVVYIDYLLFHVAKKFWVMRDSNIIHCKKKNEISVIYIQFMESGVMRSPDKVNL